MSPNLFFVLGAPKSGTTWLRHVLSAHPNIHCHSEGAFHAFRHFLWEAIEKYNRHLEKRKALMSQEAPAMTDAEAVRLLRSFILIRMTSSLPGNKQLQWIGEKDPDHAFFAREIMQAFPAATYIHIIRDGRDQCVSFWHQVARTSPEAFRKRGHDNLAKFLADYAPEWADRIRNVRKEKSDIPQARYYEIRYEAMVAEPKQSVAGLFEFLGVNADESVIESCVEAGRFEKLAGGRKAGEEDRSSFFRKGVVGDWRNHFDDAMTRSFSEMTGGLLEELGYE